MLVPLLVLILPYLSLFPGGTHVRMESVPCSPSLQVTKDEGVLCEMAVECKLMLLVFLLEFYW